MVTPKMRGMGWKYRKLALALLMLGNLTNAIQTLLAPYEFAILAHGFYGCLDFHDFDINGHSLQK